MFEGACKTGPNNCIVLTACCWLLTFSLQKISQQVCKAIPFAVADVQRLCTRLLV